MTLSLYLGPVGVAVPEHGLVYLDEDHRLPLLVDKAA